MTSQSSNAAQCHASWRWLRHRLNSTSADRFSHWISAELDGLENRFSHLITKKSRVREFRASNPPNERGATTGE